MRHGVGLRGALGFALGLGMAGLVSGAVEARAQAMPSGPVGGVGGPGANMFANPYMNPFMNPLMTQQQMPAGNAALYFFAANQANGGIGSGQMSGTRRGPGNRPASAPAHAAPRGSANVPGGSSARFFARQYPSGGSPKSYYNRQDSHFPGIGR